MENRKPGYGISFLLANRLREVMDSYVRELTDKQWPMLAMLSTIDGQPTLKELVAAYRITYQNTK